MRTVGRELETRAGAGPVSEEGYFVSVTVRLPDLEPETVLATPQTRVRGYWQSGGHWIAHAGVAAEIDSREFANPDGDLIAWLRARATDMFASQWIHDLDGESRRPRLHGGLAFDRRSEDHTEPGFWEAFPSARFVLPAYEVEVDDRGAWLTATRRFEADTPADLAIDELRRRATRTREQLAELERVGAQPSPVPPATALDEPVDAERWRTGIENILAAIDDDRVRKAVLARPLDITLGEPPDSGGILAALRTANPLAHTYLVQFARDRFLLGAAPELIGALHGTTFKTMAVGGSTPRGADPESDGWLGRQLLGSQKNRVEHQIVVEDIIGHLKGIGVEVTNVPEPSLLRLPRIQHLRTELEAEVDASAHVLDFVEALHPTAAVGGDPGPAALELLTEQEPVGRGWYAGPVGWFDAAGNGEFAPALRSAVCRGPLLRLYAGAGIVEGSRPRPEWDETRVKFQTMLGALGVARVP